MPYHHMDNHDWLWAAPMMALWVIVLGLVIYAAVRLANEHTRRGSH